MSNAFLNQLYALLLEHPDGISEHALLKELQQSDTPPFSVLDHRDPLQLFRAHFLLFHALYRLRDELWDGQAAQLEIHGLCIKLMPYASGEQALARPDPLRDYYLDLSVLDETGRDQVEELLTGFWQRLLATDDKSAALATLGLSEDADYAVVKVRYRRLVMRHHPDRGGETVQLQAINEAMNTLRRCYGRRG